MYIREMTIPAITPFLCGNSYRHSLSQDLMLSLNQVEALGIPEKLINILTTVTLKLQRRITKVLLQDVNDLSRPGREPSSSRLKSDSFTTKQPIVKPLRRSSRLTTSPVTPKQPSATSSSSINPQPKPKSSTPNTSTNAATKGTFQTQSYGLKRSKKTRRFGCQMCDAICASTKELIQHYQ